MILRILSFVLLVSFSLITPSCKVKRKEYVERNGLHSDKKPSELAKESGQHTRKLKRAWLREQRRSAAAIKKRNKKRISGEYYDK